MTREERDEMALVIGAADGDEASVAALLERYAPVIHGIASRYFLPGGDQGDLLQEARLGLLEAAADFRSSRGSFRPFARLAIEREVQTAVKAATRRKHEPLSRGVSLAAPIGDEEGEGTLADTLPGPAADPCEQVIANEALHEHVVRALHLTDAEYDAFAAYLNDEATTEGGRTGCAIQRAKAKVLHKRAKPGTAAPAWDVAA